jgi:hypothetical protein
MSNIYADLGMSAGSFVPSSPETKYRPPGAITTVKFRVMVMLMPWRERGESSSFLLGSEPAVPISLCVGELKYRSYHTGREIVEALS